MTYHCPACGYDDCSESDVPDFCTDCKADNFSEDGVMQWPYRGYVISYKADGNGASSLPWRGQSVTGNVWANSYDELIDAIEISTSKAWGHADVDAAPAQQVAA